MTNFEKVKEEIKIEDIGSSIVCQAIHRLKNEGSCDNRTCEECQKWLAEEYVELITLTEAERVILQNVDKAFKYIVRDKDGDIFLFDDEPYKINSYGNWICDDGFSYLLEPFNHLFQFIKWEDTEPYKIAELLKEE